LNKKKACDWNTRQTTGGELQPDEAEVKSKLTLAHVEWPGQYRPRQRAGMISILSGYLWLIIFSHPREKFFAGKRSELLVKPNRPIVLIPIVVLMALLIYAGNFLTGGSPYSANLDELRAQFNKDKGKVRLVTLLAPT
jgi:hypothetical protein